jgi:hypothetical protein
VVLRVNHSFCTVCSEKRCMYYIPGLFRGKNKSSLAHGRSIPAFDPDRDSSSTRGTQSPAAHLFLPHPIECSLSTRWIVISETSIFDFLLIYFFLCTASIRCIFFLSCFSPLGILFFYIIYFQALKSLLLHWLVFVFSENLFIFVNSLLRLDVIVSQYSIEFISLVYHHGNKAFRFQET